MDQFFTGCHQPCDAGKIPFPFVSISRLRDRKSDFPVIGPWVLDSGAFQTLDLHGRYLEEPEVYAAQIIRWSRCGQLLAAVTQDYMCEPWMLKKTGLTVADHQRLTVERYDKLLRCETGIYIMPVLQGYAPEDYVAHIRQYGSRLEHGAWVGVGSVCKRNGKPKQILDVLMAIKLERPDLRLHGFGLKITALNDGLIRALLYSADSMAWSLQERKAGRSANHHSGAIKFQKRIAKKPTYQGHFIEVGS